MKARIVALDFGKYLVDIDGNIRSVHLPKTLRLKKKPIVGDVITLDETHSLILSIEERKTYLARPRLANLDHLFIVNSLVEPPFSFNLLMMFMCFATYHHIQKTILITKLDKASLTPYQEALDYLHSIGEDVVFVNRNQEQDRQKLIERMQGKVVAFAGQTGVGKSSLINLINPDFQRQIGSYSEALGRGRHETKEVKMVPFLTGYLVDTPGFSSLELPMLKKELAQDFPGFSAYVGTCKFANCLHLDEPGCTIKAEVKAGKIPVFVYETYQKLSETCLERKHYE